MKCALLVLALISASVLPVSVADDQAPEVKIFFSGGIVNVASRRGLDVAAESMADGAVVQLWDFGGKGNQSWDIVDLGRNQFRITNQQSRKVLEVKNQDSRDGQPIQQFRWHNGDNQKWRLRRSKDGSYEIINVATNKCLDANTATSNRNGGTVQQWTCSHGNNQGWRLVQR